MAIRQAERKPGDYSKRQELANRSVLLINQSLGQNEIWNEDLIDQRGRDLADRIVRTWPGPSDAYWSEPLEDELGRVGVGVAVSVLDCRYPIVMSEARDVVTDTGLEPEELAWLDDRIAEYQELLAYLRDH